MKGVQEAKKVDYYSLSRGREYEETGEYIRPLSKARNIEREEEGGHI